MSLPTLVVGIVSLLVPSTRRRAWRAEWEAELAHGWYAARRAGERPTLAGTRLLLRAIASVPDALWIRWRHGPFLRPGLAMRDAIRGLVRRRAYSLTVIGTLALGVGSATAIFTVVDALFLRPIPRAGPAGIALHGSRNRALALSR